MGKIGCFVVAMVMLVGGVAFVNCSVFEVMVVNLCGVVSSLCVVVFGLVVEFVIWMFLLYLLVFVNFALAFDGKIFVVDKLGRVFVYFGLGVITF